uniref:Syndetin-like n=3 Tax=Hirondellea gigas TaxID=1518452 RepID=A0A6A7G7D6_9CRUS
MDIKEKFKTLIDKKKASKTPRRSVSMSYLAGVDSWSSSDFDGHLAVVGHQSRKSSLYEEVDLSKEAQDVVIGTIEPIYFQTDDPDVGSHELEKFPDIGDIHVINGIRSRLRKQQAIVSRRVSDLIMAKQQDCMDEMRKIDKLQKEGCLAVAFCIESRKSLNVGREKFTNASLHIISNYNKRQRIVEVINNLKTIRTLQMTDIQLQKLLKAEDYPGAIQLLLECQTAAATFKHFSCISELSSKLQETLEMAEQQLDCAVNRVVVNFNVNTYTKLHTAYSLLNKRQTLMDQLHLHLTSHIHNSAFTIVLGYVELYSSVVHLNSSNINGSVNNITTNSTALSSFSKMQYSDICKYIDAECFLTCYVDLCKSMWGMLRNYKAIISWHHKDNQNNSENLGCNNNDNIQKQRSDNSATNSPSKTGMESHKMEDSFDEGSYVEQKLQHGLYRIWQDVQAKIRTFILASDLSHFKFDDFLKVLDVTNKLVYIGEDFCGSKSEALRDSVKKQSTSFFQREHTARLEELHMFLENEAWQIVPLKANFTVYQLLEYRFLKVRDNSDRSITSISSPTKRQDLLWSLDCSGSPFDVCSEDSIIEEDILASNSGGQYDHEHSDEDSDDEDYDDNLRREFVEDNEDSNDVGQHLTNDVGVRTDAARRAQTMARVAVVSNTSLAILRLVGKYLRMMKLLQPIAYDVFVCLTQLVHYYLYTICHTFGLRSGNGLSSRLSGLLQRIERDIIIVSSDGEDAKLNDNADQQQQNFAGSHGAKVYRARASAIISEEPAYSVSGISTRVVACESLCLLYRELCDMRSNPITALLPPNTAAHRLNMFYSTMTDVLPEVVQCVYGCVGSGAVQQQQLVQQMAAVNWSISSLESQHNVYVDHVLQQLQCYGKVLSDVRCSQPVPAAAEAELWRAAVSFLHCSLLQGYATARSCSNEGRSHMQLDYQQLTSKLEPLSGLRPLPGRELVEGFIKAFYLPEAALREWLQQHSHEYSIRHLTALVGVMSHVPKHARTAIVSAIETGD